MATDGPTTPTDANGKPAKARLSQMLTVAVGLVDRAANERTFLVVKRDGEMADAQVKKDDDVPVEDAAKPPAPPVDPDAAAPPPEQNGMSLPAAAKQALTDGLEEQLQKLTAIAEMINGAKVDDTAAVPPELVAALDEAADQLDMLADSFAPDVEATEMAAKPPPPPAEKPEQKSDAPVVKAAIKKAGRRIAKARLEQLQCAHDMHGTAHGMMGSLLKDLNGVPEMKAKTPPPPPPAPPPPAAKVDDEAVAKAVKLAVEQALTPVIAPLVEMLQGATTAVKEESALDRLRKAVGLGNSRTIEAPPAEPAKKRVTFPADMSAEVMAEEAAKRREGNKS